MKTAKHFAILAGLALALMAVLSFTGCSKKGEIAKVAPESDFEFELSEDGTFIALTKYKGNAKDLVIPETIQGVPVEVISGFSGNEKIKSVVIPSSAKVIRNLAFSSCASLEKVTLPEGLLYIDGMAFYATGLTSVTLPKSLEHLDYSAFGYCDNLAEINIPDDAAFLVKNADESAVAAEEIFYGRKINESVALQKKLKEIKCINPLFAIDYYRANEKYKKYEKYFSWS